MANLFRGRERSGSLRFDDLEAVTVATNGAGTQVEDFKDKTVFINVSVNTGAVTVRVEASPDNTTWYQVFTKTYTAVTATDVVAFTDQFPFLRTTSTTQTDATVSTIITARS